MDDNPKNEVLIQTQTKDIEISGVVFTRKIETDAPHYVINYDDSGSCIKSSIFHWIIKLNLFINPGYKYYFLIQAIIRKKLDD